MTKTAEVADTSNHVIGSCALGLSATADFDRDGKPGLAVPSLDRRSLRLIAFSHSARDIARVAISARFAIDFATVQRHGRPAILLGLENGQLVLVHERQ